MTRSQKRMRRVAGALAVAFVLVTAAPAAQADAHDAQRSGHPVRILAYLLHPIGVILDYTIMRPAHWLGHHEPFQTLFGHEDH